MFANLTWEVSKLLSNLSSIILNAASGSVGQVSDSSVVSNADAAGKSILETMAKSELMVVVTITGIVVVFSMLVLLTLLFAFYGKIADGIGGKAQKKSSQQIKKAASASKAAPAAAVKKTSSQQSKKSVAPAAPVTDGSIPEEIVAVIAAAVASMSDGNTGYSIQSIRRSPRQGVSAWRRAALAENTRRF